MNTTQLKAKLSIARKNRQDFEDLKGDVNNRIINECMRDQVAMRAQLEAAHNRIDDLENMLQTCVELLESSNQSLKQCRDSYAKLASKGTN